MIDWKLIVASILLVVSILVFGITEAKAGPMEWIRDNTLHKDGCSIHRVFENKTENWVYGLSFLALLVDYGTTLDMTRRYDEGYFEQNTYLGTHPSRDRVNRFFIKRAVLQGIVNACATTQLKTAVNLNIFYVNGKAGANSLRLGLEVKFK